MRKKEDDMNEEQAEEQKIWDKYKNIYNTEGRI